MIRWIVGTSLRFRFLVVAFALVMMGAGGAAVRGTPVDVFPEFAPPRVEIQSDALGFSTTEVEDLITVPLEAALAGTPRLQTLRSKSVPGLSSVELIFQPKTDIWLARQWVTERLTTALPDIPGNTVSPLILAPKSATSRVMKIGVTSKTLSPVELSTIVKFKLRSRLMEVPGVANVSMWGEKLQVVQVRVDPERLRAHGLSIQQIMDTTGDALEVGLQQFLKASSPGSGGWIDTPQQRLAVNHTFLRTTSDLASVPVKLIDGRPVTLGDVGEVQENNLPLIGDAVINDGPGLLLVVEKFPWGNTLEVTRGVEKGIAEVRPALAGIDIDTAIFRPATFIELAFEHLTASLLVGALLVILVLLLFLWDWRIALISALIIPASVTAALLALRLQDATLNVLVLAGLVVAIGPVVDTAIVGVENVVRRHRVLRGEGSTKSTAEIVRDASIEVRSAITYATLIEVAILVPVFFLGGLSGSFFQPLAQAYVLAALAAMVIALTLTPALLLILLSKVRLRDRVSPIVPSLHRGYNRILGGVLKAPLVAYGTLVLVMAVGLAATPLLGQELLPAFKERDFLMHWVTAPGTSRPEMIRMTTQASAELRSIPGVRNFGAHIGRALTGDEIVGINFTENWVSVDPKVNYDQTVNAIRGTVRGYPGIVRDVQTYLKERTKEVLTGTGDTIVVRIFGPDLPTLRAKADEVRQALAGIDGLVDLHMETQVDIPQVEIKVDLAAAGRYGLKPGDVRRDVAVILASTGVGDVYREQKQYDAAIWNLPQTFNNLTSIRDLLVDTPDGGFVRLGDIADVRVVATPNEIKHEGNSRRIDVSANVHGRDLGSVVDEVKDHLESIALPLGYHSQLLGEFAEREQAQQRLLLIGAIALVGIFLLLQAAFGSWRLAAMAFLALPAALPGGLLAAYFGGGVLSLGSLVGFLTVLGIASRNGIMLISHYQHLEREEGVPFGPELVLRGARERLAPILMTALATAFALVPLAVAGNIAGQEIEYPMAIVILGGLITSTLLNLLIVPALYLRFGRGQTAAVAELRSQP
jgi:CzcA family heavy metal efflux pump